MELLEIMKRWGVNDTPNNIRHFEQEVRECYKKIFSEERLADTTGGVNFFHAIDIDKKVNLGSCNNCLNSDEEFILQLVEEAMCMKCNNSWLIE